MERLLLEISVGTVVAGGIIVAYARRMKNKIRARILRDYTDGKITDGGGLR